MSRFVRASITMTLVSAVVVIVLTVLGARACTASSGGSPIAPLNVARNGLAGLCAQAQASGPADTLDPTGLQALRNAAGANLVCPTTTTAP
ncbi:MAG TPA: hypothetical protein VHT75_11075 [Acidimicrobiales bacterium]|jgi:hypothetical protein|nr:hypothetical protein [Acidimicrobiales bacterium]